MPPHDDLLVRRGDYPILDTCTYLISNSLGAMHRDSEQRLADYAGLWRSRGVLAWDEWFPAVREAADLVAEVIGAPPGSVVMRQNVSDSLVAATSALDLAPPRTRVVCTALDWPGTFYFWRAQPGVDLHVVPAGADGVSVDADRLLEAVDQRVAVVSVSLVAFRTSALLDVRPLVDRAHEVGAVVLLDAYQGVGALPVDVAGTGVDVCVGGSVKFLCGGPGNGWLYVRPDLASRLRPRAVGWLSDEAPFDFVVDDIRYAPGVARFTGGTPGVPAAYAALPGYRAVAEVGVDRIRERSMALTQLVADAALQHGFTVRSPLQPSARGGHVTVDPGDSAHVHAELTRRGFLVDHRPDAGIRVAPHFYNSADECLAVVAEMARIRGGR